MVNEIEFKNFEQKDAFISADLYLEGEFVVKLSDDIMHILNGKTTHVGLYEYFRKAITEYLSYIKYHNADKIFVRTQSDTTQ